MLRFYIYIKDYPIDHANRIEVVARKAWMDVIESTQNFLGTSQVFDARLKPGFIPEFCPVDIDTLVEETIVKAKGCKTELTVELTGPSSIETSDMVPSVLVTVTSRTSSFCVEANISDLDLEDQSDLDRLSKAFASWSQLGGA